VSCITRALPPLRTGRADGYRRGEGTGPRFVDYVSDIVVFTSADGRRYEYGYVLASAGIGPR